MPRERRCGSTLHDLSYLLHLDVLSFTRREQPRDGGAYGKPHVADAPPPPHLSLFLAPLSLFGSEFPLSTSAEQSTTQPLKAHPKDDKVALKSTHNMLGPIVELNNFLAGTFLPTHYLPLTACLHALRVSLAYRAARARTRAATPGIDEEREKQRESWTVDVAGFLVMSWGGSFLVAYLSNNVPLQLLSPYPLWTYLSIHVVTTLVTTYLPVSAVLLDTILPLIDGATRTAAVVAGVNVAAASANPLVSGSLFFQILLGTLAASGGGQLAGTLSVFNPDVVGWKFSTPPFLRARNFAEANDVLAALGGALTYSCLSASHPAWRPVLTRISSSGAGIFGIGGAVKWAEADARAATTLVIAAFFAARAIIVHWTVKSPKSVGQRLKIEQSKSAKRSGRASSAAAEKGSVKATK